MEGGTSCQGFDIGHIVSPPTQTFLRTKHGSNAVDLLREINARMQLMPRATDFQLPYCDGCYVPDHSRVQAKEHRNVMQVLPFMYDGIDADLTELTAE